ncbi:predicted protein [Sclerotinia sclerotiorum 1980 UF-70]|uniref:Uncharacterized protein n=1 Tax=Sclerotinia sclerotiorum (strain ATCC 18683 / 1980 / Ss-1) TaxID=665079 RepID=A7EGD4_SCLS1|nr:predicted protein [Sclerotinia sclerotiorum 1980 UF-70]EDO01900.1 predicted protein [Sclerotinia sclerotiorum 1980 UF-70]
MAILHKAKKCRSPAGITAGRKRVRLENPATCPSSAKQLKLLSRKFSVGPGFKDRREVGLVPQTLDAAAVPTTMAATTSQTNGCSAESTQDGLFLHRGQSLPDSTI